MALPDWFNHCRSVFRMREFPARFSPHGRRRTPADHSSAYVQVLEERLLLAAAALDGETLVNTTTSGIQEVAPHNGRSVAAFADGGSVIVWTSSHGDGSSSGVFGQRYDSTGHRAGSEFRINATTASAQKNAAVAAAPDGRGFVVAWQSYWQDGSRWGVVARVFDQAGNPTSDEFVVNEFTEGHQAIPAVTVLDDGRIVVVWNGRGSDSEADGGAHSAAAHGPWMPSSSDDLGVFARVFASDGTALTGDLLVNQTTHGAQSHPDVVAIPGGRFVVTWDGKGPSDAAGVFARLFDADGRATSSEFRVNQTPQKHQWTPSVARLEAGFAVLWNGHGVGDTFGVFVRRFDEHGDPLGPEIRVNQTVTGLQSHASLATGGDGFAVAWDGKGVGDHVGVFFRPFKVDGTPLDIETRVNTKTIGGQHSPTVVHTNRGPIVTWSGRGPGDKSGVFVRHLDDGLFPDKIPHSVDFESDGNGGPLAPGQIIDDEFAAIGFTVTTHDPVHHPAMIFDSSAPSGGDFDLGTPNEDFGGPGWGRGGGRHGAGSNKTAQGNILIISEDADSSDPDDNVHGGQLIFNFDDPVVVYALHVLDIDEHGGRIDAFDADGNLVTSTKLKRLGENSIQVVTVEAAGVARLVVHFPSDGGLARLDFSQCVHPPTDEVPPVITAALANDTGSSDTDGVTNDPTITGNVSDDDSGVATLMAEVPPGQFVDVPFDDDSGDFTYAPAAAADGEQTVTFKATDNAGNESFFDVTFVLDTTAPFLTVDLDPLFDSDPVGDMQTTFDVVTLAGETVAGGQVKLLETGQQTTADANGRFSFPDVALALGENAFTATATDVAGNSTTIGKTITRLAPELAPPIIAAGLTNDTAPGGMTNNDGITSDPSIGGSVTDAHDVVSFRAGLDGAPLGNFSDVLSDLGPDGTFAFSPARLNEIFGGTLTQGLHTLHLAATDEFGNESPLFDVTFVLDTLAPPLSLDLDPDSDTDPDGDKVTQQTVVTLLGETDPNQQVTLAETGDMTQADAAGNFTFPDVPLLLGENTFTIEAVDAAGNASSLDATFTREDVLVEGTSFTVQTGRSFTVPDTPSLLNVEFANLIFDPADGGFINDAFELALLDAEGRSLVPTIAAGRDAFFNITEELPAESAPDVTRDGDTVTLDLSGVLPGTPATLVARLVNNDSDEATTVTITGVTVKNNPNPIPNGHPGSARNNATTGPMIPAAQKLPIMGPVMPSSATAGTEIQPGSPFTAARSSSNGTPSGAGATPSTPSSDELALIAQQAGSTSATFDTRGTEFWVGFMDNLFESGNVPQKAVFITGDVATTGFVEIPGLIDPATSLPFRAEFAVNPGDVTAVDLPSEDPNDTTDDQTDFDVEVELISEIQRLGVHIVTEDPVTVYGINRAVNTSDAFLALPVDVLGTEYINLGYGNGSRLLAGTPNTEFLVVATEDGTTVNITPGIYTFSTTGSFVQILRPAGTQPFGGFSPNGSDLGPILTDEPGAYSINVDPPFDGYSGTYRFELIDLESAATGIDIGELVTTTIPTGGEARVFSFDAAAGQRLYYDAVIPTTPQLSLRLITPSGIVRNLNPNNDESPLAFSNSLYPESGTYYILLVGEADAAFDFSFRMQDIDAAPALPLNAPVEGTMPFGREADIFQFEGAAGQRLVYDAFNPDRNVGVSIYGPGNTLVFSTTASDDRDPFALPEDGIYFVVVGGGTFVPPASYGFQLLDVSAAPLLPLGTPVSGSFADGKSVLYRFPGGPAQQALVDIQAGSNLGRTDVEVFGVTNTRVGIDNNGADFTAPLITGGEYLVRVKGTAVGDSGEFTFQLDVTDDPVVAKSGFNTQETLTIAPGETATYEFSAPAGTAVLLDGQDTVDESLRIRVFDPDGAQIVGGFGGLGELSDADPLGGPFFLQKSGTYTLSVTGANATAAGSYTFQMVDVEIAAVPIAFDTTVSDTLPIGRETVVYSFTATEGQVVAYDGVAGSSVTARVFNSHMQRMDGILGVFGGAANTDGRPRTLQAGVHFVVLQGTQNTATDYAFRILDFSSVPELTLGTEVSGTLTPGRSQSAFHVMLTAGQRVRFDSLDDDNEQVSVRIRTAAGRELLTNVAGTDSASFLFPVAETGEYFVIVEGNQDADADFRFKLDDVDAAHVLAFDTDIDVTLDPGRQTQIFRFDATAGQTIHFDRLTASSNNIIWRVFNAAGRDIGGNNIAQDVSVRPFADGSYYLVIAGNSNAPAETISFRASVTDDPPVAPTGFNSEVTLNVDINSRETYTFDAPAGRITYLNVLETEFAIPEQTVTLNEGETYLVHDLRDGGFSFLPDLTGSVITSDKPVAVFGGSRAAFVPTNFFAADHLVEQLTPTQTWGREFVTMPLATGTTVGDRFRFLAQTDGTEVFVDGTLAATLNRGEFHEQVLVDPAHITSNQPILVAQYAHSQEFYRNQPGGDPAFLGDPLMMIVPPSEQFLSNYTVTTPAEESIPEGERFDRNFINIVAPADAVGLIEVDGAPVLAGDYTPIGASGFFGAQVPVELGSHDLAGPSPFGVFVYGFGSFDSYGYTGGQSLSAIATVAAVTLTPETATEPAGDDITLTALVTDDSGNPVEGVRVDFTVDGVNPQTGFAFTDAAGRAEFTYTGLIDGRDVVTASVGQILDESIIDWVGDVAAPTITIVSPADGSVIPAGTTIAATGIALADLPFASMDAVLVNGVPVQTFDGAGNFFSQLAIGPGENFFEFVAVDSLGMTASARLTLTGTQTAAGDVDFSRFSDVTGSFQPEYARTSYNADTRTLFADVSIHNIGQFPADVPLLVGITNISDPRVLVRDTDGVTPDGIPFYDFTGLTNGRSLAPGGETGTLSATFFNPNQGLFTYDLVFFGRLNQAPQITSLPPVEAIINGTYTYDVDAVDPEGDDLTFALSQSPAGMTIDPASGLITWTPTADDRGSRTVSVEVDDGRGGIAEQTFVLNTIVAPPNRAPVFTTLPPVLANVGSLYEYDADAVDADGDVLTFMLIEGPAGMTVDAASGLVTWTPTADQITDHNVTIEVADSSGAAARQSFTLCGNNAIGNHAPVIISEPLTQTPPGLYEYDAAALDPDSDDVVFSLPVAPAGMTIDPVTGLITWDPALAGDHNVTVRATDTLGAFVEQSFTLTVVHNEPPSITSAPVTAATVGQNYFYDVNATDPDTDPLSFRLLDSPVGMTINPASGQINWLPNAAAFERERVIVEVADGRGGTDVQQFDIDVTGGVSLQNNLSPLFTSIPPTAASVGQTLLYRAGATDPNDDPLTIDLPLAPTGMAVDPATGTLAWEPTADQVGRHPVVLRAKDGRGGVRLQAFDIDVAPANTAPVITSMPPLQATSGRPFAYRVFAQDADGDPLDFSLSTAPAGATITPLADGSTMFSYTPGAVGVDVVEILVGDGKGGEAAQSFDLNVVAPNGNHEPVTDSVPRASIAIDRTWVYILSARDADADPLTLSLDTAPAGMTFDPATGLATWTPTAGQLGANQVTFTADDGQGGVTEQSFSVEVVSFEENSAPVIVSTPTFGAQAEELYAYDLRALDHDNDPVEWSLIDAPVGMSLDAALGTLRWTPTLAQLGPQQVTIQAADPFSATGTQSITVFVSCTDLPPVITSHAPSEAFEGERYVYPVRAIDPEGGALSFEMTSAPAGMTIDAALGIIRWTPDAGQLGAAGATIEVADAAGNVAVQSFSIEVSQVERNLDPVITSRPLFRAVLDELYEYQLDARDPEGDALTFSLLTAPAGMTIDADGLIQWTPTSAPDQSGPHIVEVAVTDPQGGRGIQRYALLARANQPPQITSLPVETVSAGAVYRYDVRVDDPDGDDVTFSLGAAPAGLAIDAFGRLIWSTTVADTGMHTVEVVAIDVHGDSTTQSFTLDVAPDAVAPSVEILLSANPAAIGSDVVISVRASDDVGVDLITLTVDGKEVGLDANGTATFTSPTAGLFDVTATATDESGNVGTAAVDLRVVDPSDTIGPVITLISPTANAVVTTFTDIIGTIIDDNLDFYRLEYARADLVDVGDPTLADPDFKLLAEGTTVVDTADVLATFDPTMLMNDSYVIRVIAQDASGNLSAQTLPLSVDGELKLGQFALEFTDLSIPLTGIPIEITRSYDTRQADEQGDFGFGWTLGLLDAQIRESIPVNPLEEQGLFFAATPFRAGTRVYLTNPEGRRVGFTFDPQPQFSLFGGGSFDATFVPDPGVTDTLDVGTPALRRVNGAFVDGFAGSPFNPAAYRLTTKDGTVYEYGQFSGLQYIIDNNGNRLEFRADGVFSSTGESIQFVRDPQGRIAQIIDPAGNPLTYTYDLAGDLTSFADQIGLTTHYTYLDDPAHFLDTIIDPLGRTVLDAEFDADGRLTSTTDALGNAVRQDYDLENSLFSTTDANGNVTQFHYDALGNVTEQIDALGNSTFFEYTDPANPFLETRIVDARGNETLFTYDERGNRTSRTDALGGTTTFAYDSANNIVEMTDPLGRTERSTYDDRSNLISRTDANGNTESSTYDAHGRRLTQTDKRGNTTSFEYNSPFPLPTLVSSADGATQRFDYDGFGNTTNFTDELGNLFTTEYDSLGRRTRILGPSGEESVFLYDGPMLVEQQDRIDVNAFALTHFAYDANDRLIERIDAEGGATEFAYDSNGNVIVVRDPVGNETTFTYDALDRVSERRDAFGNASTYDYDAEDNPTTVVDRNGRQRHFKYDESDRLVMETWMDSGTVLYTATYAYDAVGNIVIADDPHSTLAFTYDNLNQVTSVDNLGTANQPRLVLTYEYDASGNQVLAQDSEGITVASQYDSRDRLSVRTWDGSPIDAARIEFDYNPRGDTTEVRRFNDRISGDLVSRSAFDHDFSGRVVDLQHEDHSGTPIVAYDYQFDFFGRLTFESHHGDSTTYLYDLNGQLLGADRAILPDEFYAYDANGNRTQSQRHGSEYRTDLNNQLATDGAFTYEYDGEGNLIGKTDLAADRTTEYDYDYRGRLTRVTERTSGGVIVNDVSYTYDVFNRRIATTANGTTTTYTYNGDHAWADFGGAGEVQARYLFGDTIDAILARYRPGEGVAWYLVDRAGTVRDVIDATAAVINHIDYDSFGNLLAQTNAGDGDRFAFTGREFDAVAGLYYYRARYYNPDVGRFLREDPSGFNAGDVNVYRFVKNSPTNLTDPSGLVSATSSQAGARGSSSLITKLAAAERQRQLREFGKCIAVVLAQEGVENFLTAHNLLLPEFNALATIGNVFEIGFCLLKLPV